MSVIHQGTPAWLPPPAALSAAAVTVAVRRAGSPFLRRKLSEARLDHASLSLPGKGGCGGT